MAQQRIIYLDVIRVLACCMIVLMHSPHPNAGNSGYVLVPLSFVTAAGLCIFFMISGALLLPVKMSVNEFLRRRIGKIVFPTLFWTLFYLLIAHLIDGVSLQKVGKAIISIPFSKQGHGVLWFMYTLAGLYLLSPIISPFLQQAKRKEIRFYLILWGVTLFLPWLRDWVVTDESPQGVLYYFTGYAGYFVLGYYLHTYKPKIHTLFSLLLIIVPVVALMIYALSGHKQMLESGKFWYLSAFVAMMCVGWYSLVKTNLTSIGRSKFIVSFSNCGFGIYLMHIFIMRYVLWKIDFIVYSFGGIGQIIITCLLTLAISFILTHLISYLPFAEYIIGYKYKK